MVRSLCLALMLSALAACAAEMSGSDLDKYYENERHRHNPGPGVTG
jgi:hypothetical protein